LAKRIVLFLRKANLNGKTNMKNISLLLLKVGNANSGNWESPGNPRYAHNSRKPSKESVVISVDTDSWRGKTAEIIIKRELNRLQKNTPNVIEILNNSPVKISITTDIDIKKSSGIYEDGLIRMHPKGSNFPGKYFIGNFNVDSSVEGVFRHELGHHIDHVTNIADGKFTAAIFEGMKKQNLDPSKTKERRKYISDIISSYGSINMGEAFAEAFTAYTHSKYNEKGRPRLPISVEKVFDELLKVKEKSLAEYLIEVKGGSGSGNRGHRGRPGQIGGSGVGGNTLHASKNPLRDISISTIKKQIDGISKTYHAKKVRKTFDDDLFAVDHSLPKSKLIKEVESKLNKDLKNVDVCIRMKTWCLEKLLFDKTGRIKSQFEVKNSSGIYDKDIRSRMERQVLNNKRFNMKKSPDTATIYGYLSKKAGDAFDAFVSSYGENTIVLKKDVRERTTFTSCDSLQNCWTDDSIPSPINNPSIYSVSHLKLLEGKSAVGAMERIFKVHGRQIEYYEAQIHGRVKISDIDKIYLTKDKFDKDDIKKISKRLDKLKIPYEWMKNEELVGGGRITYQ